MSPRRGKREWAWLEILRIIYRVTSTRRGHRHLCPDSRCSTPMSRSMPTPGMWMTNQTTIFSSLISFVLHVALSQHWYDSPSHIYPFGPSHPPPIPTVILTHLPFHTHPALALTLMLLSLHTREPIYPQPSILTLPPSPIPLSPLSSG